MALPVNVGIRIILAFALTIMLGGSIARVSSPSTTPLRLEVPDEPHSLTPIFDSVRSEADVQGPMFHMLVTYDSHNLPRPSGWLAPEQSLRIQPASE